MSDLLIAASFITSFLGGRYFHIQPHRNNEDKKKTAHIYFFDYGNEVEFLMWGEKDEEKYRKMYSVIYVEDVNIETLYKNPYDIRLKKIPTRKQRFDIIRYNNENIVNQKKTNEVFEEKIKKIMTLINKNADSIQNIYDMNKKPDLPAELDRSVGVITFYPSYLDDQDLYDIHFDDLSEIVEREKVFKDIIFSFREFLNYYFDIGKTEIELVIITFKSVLTFIHALMTDANDPNISEQVFDEMFYNNKNDVLEFDFLLFFTKLFNLGQTKWVYLTNNETELLEMLKWGERLWDSAFQEMVENKKKQEEQNQKRAEVIQPEKEEEEEKGEEEEEEEVAFNPDAINDGVLKDGKYWITGPNGIWDVSNAQLENDVTNVYNIKDENGNNAFFTPITDMGSGEHHSKYAQAIEVRNNKIYDIGGNVWTLDEEKEYGKEIEIMVF